MDPQALGRHYWPGLWLIIQTVPLFVSLALNWYKNSSGKVTVARNMKTKQKGWRGVVCRVRVGNSTPNGSLASAQGQEW